MAFKYYHKTITYLMQDINQLINILFITAYYGIPLYLIIEIIRTYMCMHVPGYVS